MEKEQKIINKLSPDKLKKVLSGINKFESNINLLESIWAKEKGLSQETVYYFDNGRLHNHKLTR